MYQTVIRTGPAILVAAALSGGFHAGTAISQDMAEPAIEDVTVNAVLLPYFDHSQASIGLAKGYFADVGITFAPDGKGTMLSSADQSVPIMAAGNHDIMSFVPQGFMPAVSALPKTVQFTIGDLFLGYALMAQPDAGYKSFKEFVAEGASSEDGFRMTVEQMRGKRFAFPAEAAIKGFIDLSLSKAGLTLEDMEVTVAPDANTTRLMQAGRADFQVGGVPSRLTLEVGGFLPILTSGDLAGNAAPSADSEELRAVVFGGWHATEDWINANRDTVLRLASVSFRINKLINDDPVAALEIHVPFLNSAAGTTFDVETGRVVYSSLDPFLTFEMQKDIFDNPDNPLNVEYVVGSAVNLHEELGTWGQGEYTWEDFVIAHDIYREMEALKAETESTVAEVKAALDDLGDEKRGMVEEWLAKAEEHYGYLNYLDAAAFAKYALALANG